MTAIFNINLSVGNAISFDKNINTYTVGTDATTASIQAAINTASYGAVFQFTAGTHTLTQTLNINKDGVTLRGDASGGSTIVIASNVTKEGISFAGGVDRTYTSKLDVAVEKGSHTITVSDANGLQVGDVIRISQSNDLEFLKTKYTNIIGDAALDANPLRESMGEILSISGNMVTLKHAVGYDMDGGGETTVERLRMLDDVGIHDLTVTYTLGTPDAGNFTNTLKAFKGADAVLMTYTNGAEVSNLSIINAASTGLEMRNALDAHVNGLNVSGAHNKDDANGYGLHIAGSFYSTYENLVITDVRHAVLFSSWNAEIGNVVQVDYTNRDINYHGSDDYGNVVIIDRAVYQDGRDSWALVSPGGSGHAVTNIDANTTLFGYAEGGLKSDILRGRDTGSELYGHDGNDTLFGGAGSDVLSGGTGNDGLFAGAGNDILLGGIGMDTLAGGKGQDVLTGGVGRDNFIMMRGDGADIITDFQAGRLGDTLTLVGYSRLLSFADLKFVQVGQDVKLMFRGGDSILFKNTFASFFTADNFVIDATGAEPIAESVIFKTTSKVDRFFGGNGDDIVVASSSSLRAPDTIDLGDGVDVLKFTGSRVSIDLATVSIKGVDVIDLTDVAVNRLVISHQIFANTDDGNLVIAYGTGLIKGLDISRADVSHDVILRGGSGHITFANAVNNRVVIENDAYVTVKGGTGHDTIISHGVGAWIEGGGGNDWIQGGVGADTLTGGLGRDTFAYTDVSQFGDTIRDFSTVLASADTLDLTALFEANGLGGQTTDSALAAGYLQLQQIGGATAVLFDRDGSVGNVYGAQTIATLERTFVDHLKNSMIEV